MSSTMASPSTPPNTPVNAPDEPVNPIVEEVLEEIISNVEAQHTQRRADVTDAQLAEAGRRILQAGTPSEMFAALMKHPVTGEPIDYEESRMFFG